MLETIPGLCRRALGRAWDGDTVRERHCRFYLALAGRLGTDQALVSTSRNEHFSRLDAETGNFAAALEWAAAQVGRGLTGDAESAIVREETRDVGCNHTRTR
jgi:hypothetical protein